MSAPLLHPTIDAALAIHAEVLAAHGGSPGLRSRELLESAVAAPQATMMGVPMISDPIEIAAAYLFYLSSNHPFVDGNGRTARIMMNAELVAAGEERIIIPTVYRGNYLAALKALSQNQRPNALIRTLDFAQKWTASIDWAELRATQQQLERCNAFLDPVSAEDLGKRLKLPNRGFGICGQGSRT